MNPKMFKSLIFLGFVSHLHVCVFDFFSFLCFWRDGFPGKMFFRSHRHLCVFAVVFGRWGTI